MFILSSTKNSSQQDVVITQPNKKITVRNVLPKRKPTPKRKQSAKAPGAFRAENRMICISPRKAW